MMQDQMDLPAAKFCEYNSWVFLCSFVPYVNLVSFPLLWFPDICYYSSCCANNEEIIISSYGKVFIRGDFSDEETDYAIKMAKVIKENNQCHCPVAVMSYCWVQILFPCYCCFATAYLKPGNPLIQAAKDDAIARTKMDIFFWYVYRATIQHKETTVKVIGAGKKKAVVAAQGTKNVEIIREREIVKINK